MTDELPDQFIPEDAECIGGTYNPYKSLDFREVSEDDAIQCPDCDSLMIFAKNLQTEPMDSDAEFTAYRCRDCAAVDWRCESDLNSRFERRGIAKALFMDARSDENGGDRE